MSGSSSSSSGIGITGLLGVAFIVLKLTNVIAWKWIWVLLPFWGGLAIWLITIIIIIWIASNR